MANYTPNGFSDGLFTGRVIAQNYDGSGNALRVDLSRNNALWVEDARAQYDNSGRLLTYGPSQLMDGYNNFFTSTYYNYSGTDFSKNYVQLDVFDVSANYWLKTIASKNFNVSGSTFVVNKVEIADGSGVFYTSVFNKVGDVSYNQLATYDYSANTVLSNILGAVSSYTSTKHIFDPATNAPTNQYKAGGLTSNNTNQWYNAFSRYLDLRNKNVTSLSFYGTITRSCILVVQYANPISNVDASNVPIGTAPAADGATYPTTSDYGTNLVSVTNGTHLVGYDVSGWFNTQYNTKITVSTIGTATAFGFNVPFCNAQFVRLMLYDTNGQVIGGANYCWTPNTNENYNNSQYNLALDVYASYTWTPATYKAG